jgi:hypothetical protein
MYTAGDKGFLRKVRRGIQGRSRLPGETRSGSASRTYVKTGDHPRKKRLDFEPLMLV